MYIVYEV